MKRLTCKIHALLLFINFHFIVTPGKAEAIETTSFGHPSIGVAAPMEPGRMNSQNALTPLAADDILYVRKGATGDGSSWNNALGEVAEALSVAKALNNDPAPGSVSQIWVARGTYLPMYNVVDVPTDDDRDKAFLLVRDVALYGGFLGNETEISQRDLTNPANETILSGDLLGNDGPDFANNDDNAYHVVIGVNDLGDAGLDGFTVRGGNANGSTSITIGGASFPRHWGGGIFVYLSAPFFTNVTLRNNFAKSTGGAIVNGWKSAPKLTNVVIIDNKSQGGAAGVMCHSDSRAELNKVVIERNSTEGREGAGEDGDGAGVYLYGASVTLNNVIIRDNSARRHGGGIYSYSGEVTMKNVLITGNSAKRGGGLYDNHGHEHPVNIINTTISSNHAEEGAEWYQNSTEPSRFVIRNSIIWGNGVAAELNDVQFSLVQGQNTTPPFSLDDSTDPLFVDRANGDFRLSALSPAVGRGENGVYPEVGPDAADLAGNPRFFGTYIDLGAYEAQCTIVAAADESEFTGELSEGDNYLYSECEVLAGVQTGPGGVSGSLKGRVWVEDGMVSHKNARFVRRHYDLSSLDEEENGAAQITLFFTKEDFQAYNEAYGTQNGFTLPVNDGENVSNLRLAQYHTNTDELTGLPESDAEFVLITPDAVVWNDALSLWEVTFGVNNFSGFFVTGQNDAALPVALASFEVRKEEKQIALLWTTTEELNASHFEIQRSLDGQNFETTGSVPAIGVSKGSQPHVYHFYDDPTIHAPILTLYYRLKMLDLDGAFAYSDLRSLSYEGKGIGSALYPNPVENGKVLLQVGNGQSGTDVIVFNTLGRKMSVPVTVSSGGFMLDVTALTPGMYLVQTSNGRKGLKLLVK